MRLVLGLVFVTSIAHARGVPIHDVHSFEGIARGDKFRLKNPTTGKIEKARVTELVMEPSGQRYAAVEWKRGGVRPIAVERLHLLGRPLAEQKAFMRAQQADVVAAIAADLQLDASAAHVRALGGTNYLPPGKSLGDLAVKGAFFTAHNGELAPSASGTVIAGFAKAGSSEVRLHADKAAFDPQVRTHEVIHTLSQDFARQAAAAHATRMMEGLTEYFAFGVATPHFGSKVNPQAPYYPALVAAQKVAELVGRDRLKAIFFGAGAGQFAALRSAIDPANTGAFDRACAHLENDRGDVALAALGSLR